MTARFVVVRSSKILSLPSRAKRVPNVLQPPPDLQQAHMHALQLSWGAICDCLTREPLHVKCRAIKQHYIEEIHC